jgi:DNA ligase (NAD+)
MLSLNNTYCEEDLRQFIGRVEKVSGGETEFAVEPKIDGLAMAVIFRDGRFAYALTRGNGAEGDDVSANVRTIGELPMEIQLAGTVEVRGEVYVDRENFLRLNAMRAEEGLEPFASARNLAVGSLRLLDPERAAERRLRFIAYDIGCGDGQFQTHSQVLCTLRSLGFPTNDHTVCRGAEETWRAVVHLGSCRRDYPFDTDGAVVKVNGRALRLLLGAQATAPRWAMAYKFSPERAETILENITLRVGRSGVLTPVADLRPVSLGGTTIRSATLHNGDDIARKDLRIGDSVIVERAGEVIPAVVAAVHAKRPPWATPFTFPDKCPACSGSLVRIGGEVACRCLNCDCPPQIFRRIQHFASKDAMDIESLGPQRISQLMDAGMLLHFVDIFRLNRSALASQRRMGDKSADRLLGAIEGAKKRPLWRLIHGLGIPHVGAETAKILAGKWPSMEKLMDLSGEQLQLCGGIGEVVAASAVKFFSDGHSRRLIAQLAEYGLSMADGEAAPKGDVAGPFAGKIFAISGTFAAMARDAIGEAIAARGGTVRKSLSKKIDMLLVGESPGSKVAEAEKLSIPTVDEGTLMGWLGVDGSAAAGI